MSEVVFALYKAKTVEQEKALEALIEKHVPALAKLGLITDRPRLTLRSADGTYFEVIEWISTEAANKAHEHPAVAQVWENMATICEFKKLADLSEASKAFSHFKVVPHLSQVFA